MTTAELIERKLEEAFSPYFVKVTDESSLHAGHAGVKKEGGGHFAVKLVTSFFEGKTTLQRHQAVYKILAEEFGQTKIHALVLQTYSEEEWISSPQISSLD